jgi:hypothetical protein
MEIKEYAETKENETKQKKQNKTNVAYLSVGSDCKREVVELRRPRGQSGSSPTTSATVIQRRRKREVMRVQRACCMITRVSSTSSSEVLSEATAWVIHPRYANGWMVHAAPHRIQKFKYKP